MLPVMDGWSVLKKIRETDKTPVIMLTAKGETEDKVSGLEQGADDYTAAVLKGYDLKKRGERVDVGAITAGWPPIPIYTQMRNNLQIIATNSNPWIDYSIAYDPSKDILAVKCPVFAAYGSLDRQVTPVNYEAMRRYRPNDDVRLFEGLNHLFQHAVSGDLSEYGEISETISPEVLEAIAAFATR